MPSKYIPKNTAYLKQPKSGKKSPPTGTDADLNLASMAVLFNDENQAREFLEAKRWPNDEVACPHCGEIGAYRLTAKSDSERPVRAGVWKCKGCRKQFSVRVGTIFEESKIPLRKWLMAIHLMTSRKKGVSSHRIAREIDVTQKTAWFLCHRIREAMWREPLAGMLKGQVEADETHVGGKPRNRHRGRKGRSGRPNPETSNKTAVLALVERDGSVVARPMPRLSAEELRTMMGEVMSLEQSRLHTDELLLYRKIGRQFGLGHGVVKHKDGEYTRGDDSTNTAESFFALLKRGHYGTFHQLSRHHLGRYCDEFSFRWEHRKTSDGQRMVAAIEGAEGKRLTYRQPLAS
jgi:transposase-like protein